MKPVAAHRPPDPYGFDVSDEARSLEVRRSDGRFSDEVRSPDGRSPDERRSDGRFSDEVRSPDGRSPDERRSDGRFSDEVRSPDGRSLDERLSDGRFSDDARWLDAGLERARRAQGYTTIAFRAPVTSAARVVSAFCSSPIVAWSSRALTVVGVGVAHELRGSGDARWSELVAGARDVVIGTTIVDGEPSSRSLIKPRFLGGLAFTPAAADRAPWTGFGDAWFMLPRWTYIHDREQAWVTLAVDAREAHHGLRWRDQLAAVRATLGASFVPRPQPPLVEIDRGDVEAWRAQVHSITDAIERGECEKIVAARSAVVTLDADVRAADLLAELDARHADCVRILVRPPGGGTLLAATPERLVSLDGATIACDALAGSRARIDREAAGCSAREELLASGKDRREHELVVRAITTALSELGEVSVPDGPAIKSLRHVLHLHTPIAATLRSPRHVLEVAARLHPTPAVGGTPTAYATRWIDASEIVPRGWYGSPVGWFDFEGNGELAVAIRSGLLAGDRAHLWAGAGIVAGSDPDRELAETELKLRAMLGALGVAG